MVSSTVLTLSKMFHSTIHVSKRNKYSTNLSVNFPHRTERKQWRCKRKMERHKKRILLFALWWTNLGKSQLIWNPNRGFMLCRWCAPLSTSTTTSLFAVVSDETTNGWMSVTQAHHISTSCLSDWMPSVSVWPWKDTRGIGRHLKVCCAQNQQTQPGMGIQSAHAEYDEQTRTTREPGRIQSAWYQQHVRLSEWRKMEGPESKGMMTAAL